MQLMLILINKHNTVIFKEKDKQSMSEQSD